MNIAIFASGTGTNALRLIEYFEARQGVNFFLYCNNQKAQVIEKCKAKGIPVLLFGREEMFQNGFLLVHMKKNCIELVVLAGFLWLIPTHILTGFPRRIINLHPSLLPAYGGKGMYGGKVHEAVIAAGESHSGITIHFANEHYDKGNVILQAHCSITDADTPETLAFKIHKLEHRYLPVVVEALIEEIKSIGNE